MRVSALNSTASWTAPGHWIRGAKNFLQVLHASFGLLYFAGGLGQLALDFKNLSPSPAFFISSSNWDSLLPGFSTGR